MKENTRSIYLDMLKIISCIAVITIHVSAVGFKNTNINSIAWNISNVFNNISRFAVPVFVMVSGALFLNENKKLDIKKLWLKNILHLVIIYIFWTLIYAIYSVYNKYGINGLNVTEVIKNAIKSSYYHLWFIPMLIGIYILIPVIKPIVKDGRKTIEYFLIIAFIFKVIPDTIKLFEFPYVKYIKAILNRINIEMIGYVVYFVLGHYLNTYVLKKKTRNIIYILGILSVVISIVGTWGYSMYKSKAVETLCREFSITTVTMSIAIFTLFKYLFDTKVFSKSFKSIIIHLSKTSLGIYLVHILFKDIMKNQLGVKFTKTYLTPVYVLIIFIASYLVSFVLSKIPKVNKYIV